MVGLGRMGANIVRRLMRDGHRCVVYDVNADAVTALADEGADGASSLAELVQKLSTPRAVWVMVPAGDITERTVVDVAEVAPQRRHGGGHRRFADPEGISGRAHRPDPSHCRERPELGESHLDRRL